MNTPTDEVHDEAARKLLKTAKKASREVLRQERGIIALVKKWMEQRAEFKQKERCRQGIHHYTDWEKKTDRRVYAAGKTAADSYPIRYLEIHVAYCEHCGEPTTKEVDV